MLSDMLRQYAEAFDDGFPMDQLGRGRSDEEVEAIISECLTQGKDAYELAYVTDDEEVDY